MRVSRLMVTGAAAVVIGVAGASAAQAAYVATATLTTTVTTYISTGNCTAGVWLSVPMDAAGLSEEAGHPCAAVTARIFFTDNRGHYWWTNTVSDPSYAFASVGRSNDTLKSYHTATR